MKTTTTAQMIENGMQSDTEILATMRQYKTEYAGSAPPNWIGEWFRAAWHMLRSRGWAVAEISRELGA